MTIPRCACLCLLAVTGCADFQMTHRVEQDAPLGVEGVLGIEVSTPDGTTDQMLSQVYERVWASTQDTTYQIPQGATASMLTGGDLWTVSREGTEVCVAAEFADDAGGSYHWSVCQHDDSTDGSMYASTDRTLDTRMKDETGWLHFELQLDIGQTQLLVDQVADEREVEGEGDLEVFRANDDISRYAYAYIEDGGLADVDDTKIEELVQSLCNMNCGQDLSCWVFQFTQCADR